MRTAFAALILLALAACAPIGEGLSTGPAVDVAACTANGGKVKPICRMRKPACIFDYADAGKTCTDSEQCSGRCVIEDEMPEVGARAIGVCEADNDVCGCSTEIIDGKTTAGRCVD
jgi:hypothetical protein